MTRRLPLYTVLSFISAPLLCFGSVPIWRTVINQWNPGDAWTQFGNEFLGVPLAASATALLGGLIGIVLWRIAHRREEPFRPFRNFTLVVNLAAIAYGGLVLYTILAN